jgi:hypothetical protein
MTNSAAELLNRVLFVQRMVGQRLRVTTVTRVIDSKMTGRASIHAVEVREKDLVDLNWYSFGQRMLLRVRRATEFFLDVFSLVIFPLAVLVFIVSEHDQTTD